jgi:hypothetical protein
LSRDIHFRNLLFAFGFTLALQGLALAQTPEQTAQSSYRLRSSVMSSAGAPSASESHKGCGTAAQPTPVGVSYTGDRVLYAGFWEKPRASSGLPPYWPPDPLVTRLHPNCPNPFMSSTNVCYSLASRNRVTLKVLDVTGRVVRTFTSAEESPGFHRVVWEGKDDSGSRVAPGIYFCHFGAGSFRSIQKIVVLK